VSLLLLALQVALVLVLLLVVWELLRLRRAALLAQISMTDLDQTRRVEQAIREAGAEARTLAKAEAVKAVTERPTAETRVHGRAGQRDRGGGARSGS